MSRVKGSTRTHRCPADHSHGTNCYDHHGCGCESCIVAHRVDAAAFRRRRAYGHVTPPVDATAARARIVELLSAKWTQRQIAQAAGVSVSTVKRVLAGFPKVAPEVEKRLLADLQRPRPVAKANVDATGTKRRLQALMAHGWTFRELASRIGVDERQITWTMQAHTVTRARADAVASLYRALWDQPAPERTRDRTRRIAARRGWVGALAWENIDDPDEQPDTADAALEPGWKLREVEHLRSLGESPARALEALGTTPDAVERMARNHHRPDLARWASSARSQQGTAAA
ncbi:helix-turn-helix domain-containing protein [Microbacterium arborescens]|uniref:helix-turn-helix domain-containing protein n=1 Tax=Microbacterium arborescens TaxID=33883 RepID=UPI0013B3886B|nr:helix-turn-helix domain-containing protein [Microbacterium arborescens]